MDDASGFELAIGVESSAGGLGGPEAGFPDSQIARLAGRQHGVVARRQLFDLGVSRQAIGHRLKTGRLHPLHRGVYAVGHEVVTDNGLWMAATLAASPGAALSHRSAAALWGMRPPSRGRVEVTSRAWCVRPGIVAHRGDLPLDEVTLVDAIPVTIVPRTLLDLATVLPRQQVERALNEAEVLRLTDRLSLPDLLERHPRRHGVAAIRAILADRRIGAAVTRSELERRFLALVAVRGLPRPEVNAGIEAGGRRYEVDCVWRRQRLIVELDGHASHATPIAYERDRARDRALSAAGWRVVRLTWRQLESDADAVERDLRLCLLAQTVQGASSAEPFLGAPVVGAAPAQRAVSRPLGQSPPHPE